MESIKTRTESGINIAFKGRLNASTADDALKVIRDALDELREAEALDLDFREMTYLASAGIRVLIVAQKQISAKKCAMMIHNVSKDVWDVFELTGLDKFFDLRRA